MQLKTTMSRPPQELKSGTNFKQYVGPIAVNNYFFSLSNIFRW